MIKRIKGRLVNFVRSTTAKVCAIGAVSALAVTNASAAVLSYDALSGTTTWDLSSITDNVMTALVASVGVGMLFFGIYVAVKKIRGNAK